MSKAKAGVNDWRAMPGRFDPEQHGNFSDWYAGQYLKKRLEVRDERRQERAYRAALAARKPAPDLTDMERAEALYWAEARHAKFKAAKTFRDRRLAGNPVLASEGHGLLRKLVEKTRKGDGILVGTDKTEVFKVSCKLEALDHPYITVNSEMVGVIRVDVDGTFPSWFALETAISGLGCPLPNIYVGLEDYDGEILNPHLIWILDESVNMKESGLWKFKGLLARVNRGLVAKLIPIGADPGGLSNGLKIKNPLSYSWQHEIGHEQPWHLAEMISRLDMKASTSAMAKARLALSPADAEPVPDHPVAEIGAMSNAIWTCLTSSARQAVTAHKATDDRAGFDAVVLDTAYRLCRHDATAEKLAAKVAEWTWTKYRGRARGPKLSDSARRKVQADAAAKSNLARVKKTEWKVTFGFAELSAKMGRQPTKAEVACHMGISVTSVAKYWQAAQHAVLSTEAHATVCGMLYRGLPPTEMVEEQTATPCPPATKASGPVRPACLGPKPQATANRDPLPRSVPKKLKPGPIPPLRHNSPCGHTSGLPTSSSRRLSRRRKVDQEPVS